MKLKIGDKVLLFSGVEFIVYDIVNYQIYTENKVIYHIKDVKKVNDFLIDNDFLDVCSMY